MRHRRQSPAERLTSYLERAELAPVKDDIRFLLACLSRIPIEHHDWAVSRYAGAWQAALEAAPTDHTRDNVGRRAANTWLRGVLTRKRMSVPDSAELKGVRV